MGFARSLHVLNFQLLCIILNAIIDKICGKPIQFGWVATLYFYCGTENKIIIMQKLLEATSRRPVFFILTQTFFLINSAFWK